MHKDANQANAAPKGSPDHPSWLNEPSVSQLPACHSDRPFPHATPPSCMANTEAVILVPHVWSRRACRCSGEAPGTVAGHGTMRQPHAGRPLCLAHASASSLCCQGRRRQPVQPSSVLPAGPAAQ